MSGHVWIAEDSPAVGLALVHALELSDASAIVSGDPEDARRWLETGMRPIILDGSVWADTGVPLEDLPEGVFLFSGDADLVEQARFVGIPAFLKGDSKHQHALLAEIEKELSR